MLAILADGPLVHFRRVLGKLIEAEKAAAASAPGDSRRTETATT